MISRSFVFGAAVAGSLALAGCAKPPHERAETNENSALGEDIMVDPALALGETGKRHHDDHHKPSDHHRPEHARDEGRGPPPPPPAPPAPPAPVVAKAPPPPLPPKPLNEVAKAPPPPPAPPPTPPKPAALAKAPPPPLAKPVPPVPPAPPATATAKATPAKSTPAPVVPKARHLPRPMLAAAARPAGECLARLSYGGAWASRLPAAFPLYPAARLTEAAGNDSPGCNARAASFTVAAPIAAVADWYRAKATKAGFSAEQQRQGKGLVLAGTGSGDSAYMLSFAMKAGGITQVDLIASGAR